MLRSALERVLHTKDGIEDEKSEYSAENEGILFHVGVTSEDAIDVDVGKAEETERPEERHETISVSEATQNSTEQTDSPDNQRKNAESQQPPTLIRNHCMVCAKTFSGHTKLTKHLINKHSVRNDQNVFKPFHCDKCEKSYTTLANLSIHKASHMGVKPFKCDVCARSFYKETSLTNHMSIHTGLRKHQCDICDRGFTSANILQQHRKTHATHRSHNCSICSKGFYTSNDLRVHFRTHTGEKPFLCSFCGRGFSRKTHLNIHLSKALVVGLGIQNVRYIFTICYVRNTFWREALQVRHLCSSFRTIW